MGGKRDPSQLCLEPCTTAFCTALKSLMGGPMNSFFIRIPPESPLHVPAFLPGTEAHMIESSSKLLGNVFLISSLNGSNVLAIIVP